MIFTLLDSIKLGTLENIFDKLEQKPRFRSWLYFREQGQQKPLPKYFSQRAPLLLALFVRGCLCLCLWFLKSWNLLKYPIQQKFCHTVLLWFLRNSVRIIVLLLNIVIRTRPPLILILKSLIDYFLMKSRMALPSNF